MARLGAQVIAGIGFIGAGTIIIPKRRQVKGLTTAAGLWAAAIVGLCCGAGFYEGAVLATLIILLAELVFAKLEYFIVSNSRAINLYVEFSESSQLGIIIDTLKKNDAYIVDMEITKSGSEHRNLCVIFSIQKPRRLSHQALMSTIARLEGVISIEEL
jgi:putative Mg2+ transporter-C (MgtC) family protein